MNKNILATAAGLSDQDLLARLEALASREREATVELVAHLAALDCRPAVYAAQGYGSLFGYCTQALRLSEDAACNRIEAARACRRFPLILDLLASGSMTLTSVRLLSRHLTLENHQAVLARAVGRRRQEIEALLAELAPRPDVPSVVRKLPNFAATSPHAAVPDPALASVPSTQPAPAIGPSPAAFVAMSRPIVQATAPARFRVQFTIGPQTHEKLRRLQTLLRREIPDGDPAAIFDRALSLLLERVEKTKLAARPDRGRSGLSVAGRIELTIPHPPRATSRARSNAPCGSATAGGALSSPLDAGARSGRYWSSTTSSLLPSRGRPRSRTFPSAAGATTNTRRSSSSGLCVFNHRSVAGPRPCVCRSDPTDRLEQSSTNWSGPERPEVLQPGRTQESESFQAPGASHRS